MRYRRYSQSLGNCIWLAIPILVGSHTFLAETAKPSPATGTAAKMQSPHLQNSTISTMPPEEQGDLPMRNGNYVAAIAAYQQSSLHLLLSSAEVISASSFSSHVLSLNERCTNQSLVPQLRVQHQHASTNFCTPKSRLLPYDRGIQALYCHHYSSINVLFGLPINL